LFYLKYINPFKLYNVNQSKGIYLLNNKFLDIANKERNKYFKINSNIINRIINKDIIIVLYKLICTSVKEFHPIIDGINILNINITNAYNLILIIFYKNICNTFNLEVKGGSNNRNLFIFV